MDIHWFWKESSEIHFKQTIHRVYCAKLKHAATLSLKHTHTQAYVPWRAVIFGPWWWPDLPAAASAGRRSCGRGPAAPGTAPSAGGTDLVHSPACPAGVRSHAAWGQPKQLRPASLVERCVHIHQITLIQKGLQRAARFYRQSWVTMRSHSPSSFLLPYHLICIWSGFNSRPLKYIYCTASTTVTVKSGKKSTLILRDSEIWYVLLSPFWYLNHRLLSSNSTVAQLDGGRVSFVLECGTIM